MLNKYARLFIKPHSTDAFSDFKYYNAVRISDIDTSFSSVEFIKELNLTTQQYDTTGFVFNDKPSVSFTIASNVQNKHRSQLKHFVDRKIPVDIQIYFGNAINPLETTEFDKILNIENAILSDYKINNILPKQSKEIDLVEEIVKVDAVTLYEIASPFLYNMNLNQTPFILDLKKINDIETIALINRRIDGSQSQLELRYSINDLEWEITNLPIISSASFNPYDFYIHANNDKIYVIIKNALNESELLIVDLQTVRDGIYNVTDILYSKFSLSTLDVNASLLYGKYLYLTSNNGYFAKFNIETLELSTIYLNELQPQNNLTLSKDKTCVFAVGNAGHIIRYNILTNSTAIFNTGTIDNVFAIEAFNINNIVIGTESNVYITNDLIKFYECEQTFSYIKHIEFITDNIGYLIDSTGLYRTVNGGFSWKLINNRFSIVKINIFKNELFVITANFNDEFNRNNISILSGLLSNGNKLI